MRIFDLIEKGIKYKAIECYGPLEYVDARCLMQENGDKCIILCIEQDYYHKSSFGTNGTSGTIVFLRKKEYYYKSKLHRDNGPAKEVFYNKTPSVKSSIEFWLNGEAISIEKYNLKLRKEKIKRLNNL